jgi:hypothetical protein
MGNKQNDDVVLLRYSLHLWLSSARAVCLSPPYLPGTISYACRGERKARRILNWSPVVKAYRATARESSIVESGFSLPSAPVAYFLVVLPTADLRLEVIPNVVH